VFQTTGAQGRILIFAKVAVALIVTHGGQRYAVAGGHLHAVKLCRGIARIAFCKQRTNST